MNRTISALAGVALALACSGVALAAKTPPPGSLAHGKTLFQQQCGICHAVAPAPAPGAGPMLKGVVGRKAGTGDKGFAYSDALKKSGLTWTQANLAKFLANPSNVVPGTTMPIALASASDRNDAVAYLATLK